MAAEMSAQPVFAEAVVFLAGAVIAAPLFKRIGLGTVLGYLAAGIAVAPLVAWMSHGSAGDGQVMGEEVLHFAELGIVFLLFIIGLELNPSRLWRMRSEIFGLGLSQVASCGLAIGLLAWAFGGLVGIGWRGAIIVGLGLALSSTAFAMQLLEERRETGSSYGRRAFSILLFQDLAIVPLLLLVPLLAPGGEGVESPWRAVFLAFGAVAALVAVGLLLLDPMLRIIARTGAREVMIAAALAVVLGAAWLMHAVGLSMAMGAFVAGVLLSESSYRHELEADIEPFRGLLLGLFFMAVGMSLDLGTLLAMWLPILIAVPLLMGVKAGVIYGLARLFGSPHPDAARIAALLPQGGEFGFVLFSAASASFLLSREAASFLIAVVTLSMALTPLSVTLGARLSERRAEPRPEPDEDFEGAGDRVLMIGFSRLGQVAYQTLLTGGQDATIIDNDPDRIEAAARFGSRVYYGDGTRKEVLEAAGIGEADIVAVTTRDPAVTMRIVDLIKADYPGKRLFARSYDRNTSLALLSKEVDYELRETLHSALRFGRDVLVALGMGEEEAETVREEVELRDAKRLQRQRTEGIMGGREYMHTKPQTPEPLDPPEHEAHVINEEEFEQAEEGRDGEGRDGEGRDGEGRDGTGATGERPPRETHGNARREPAE